MATDEVTLLAGLGVEGDTHAGVTVQHGSARIRGLRQQTGGTLRGQLPSRTARSRVVNASGSSTKPTWPPGNIVGAMPSAAASAVDVRSQIWPADCSPMPTTTRVGTDRSVVTSGRQWVVGRNMCAC